MSRPVQIKKSVNMLFFCARVYYDDPGLEHHGTRCHGYGVCLVYCFIYFSIFFLCNRSECHEYNTIHNSGLFD